jgi:hypothetical protein
MRAGHAIGMADRDGASVHVEPIIGQAKLMWPFDDGRCALGRYAFNK